jgi:hypothetical protein
MFMQLQPAPARSTAAHRGHAAGFDSLLARRNVLVLGILILITLGGVGLTV